MTGTGTTHPRCGCGPPSPRTSLRSQSGCSTPSRPWRRQEGVPRWRRPNVHRYTRRAYRYRSRAICNCSRRMQGHHHKLSYNYYRCRPTNNNRGRPDKHAGHPRTVYVREEAINAMVDQAFSEFLFHPQRRAGTGRARVRRVDTRPGPSYVPPCRQCSIVSVVIAPEVDRTRCPAPILSHSRIGVAAHGQTGSCGACAVGARRCPLGRRRGISVGTASWSRVRGAIGWHRLVTRASKSSCGFVGLVPRGWTMSCQNRAATKALVPRGGRVSLDDHTGTYSLR